MNKDNKDKDNKKVRVLISGYFDPIHIGHIDFIRRAKNLGDYLIVIVNTDAQAIMKKGKSFMPEGERVEIMKALRYVDEVILSIDKDRTVCKTVEMIKPDIFANGGDRIDGTIPEEWVCDRLGIKIINNLGEKIQSSSNLTKITKEKE